MTAPTAIVYRVQEAAKKLKCTESWLKNKAKARAIPVRLIGGAYAWTDADLEEILRITYRPPAPASAAAARRRPTPAPPQNEHVPRLAARRRVT